MAEKVAGADQGADLRIAPGGKDGFAHAPKLIVGWGVVNA
jgi:hypothetical protein